MLQFVDETLVPGLIPANKDIEEAFSEWKESILVKKIQQYAEPRGLDINILLSVFKRYNPNDEVIPDYNDLLASIKVPEGRSLLEIKMEIVGSLREQLEEWKRESFN